MTIKTKSKLENSGIAIGFSAIEFIYTPESYISSKHG